MSEHDLSQPDARKHVPNETSSTLQLAHAVVLNPIETAKGIQSRESELAELRTRIEQLERENLTIASTAIDCLIEGKKGKWKGAE